jgi:hypothetical protein
MSPQERRRVADNGRGFVERSHSPALAAQAIGEIMAFL